LNAVVQVFDANKNWINLEATCCKFDQNPKQNKQQGNT
jgi:hypothetical protein